MGIETFFVEIYKDFAEVWPIGGKFWKWNTCKKKRPKVKLVLSLFLLNYNTIIPHSCLYLYQILQKCVFQCLGVHFRCIEPGEQKILNFYDGLLRYLLSSAGRPAHIGPIGRQWLAWNSEGHRGNSKILFPLGFYYQIWCFECQNEEDAFFYHLKMKSQGVFRISKYVGKLQSLSEVEERHIIWS